MPSNGDRRNRQSTRLRDYDYAQAGAYFITICAHQRKCLFGEIVGGVMRLNGIGEMLKKLWEEMPQHYSGIEIDSYVIMPNHFHAIVNLTDTEPAPKGAHRGAPLHPTQPFDVGTGPRACPPPTMSLSQVVHRFKSLTTARYRHQVLSGKWPPFNGRVWQRNYHDHIIRNEKSLQEIREYMANNPLQWELDQNHPRNITNS